VILLSGLSGSGKSTAIQTLIRHYTGQGRTVAAIKHTHHPLNAEDRGDTGRFRRAGANPVILAGEDRAVVFSEAAPRFVDYTGPADLVALTGTDLVFVEGFKANPAWPQITLRAGEWLEAAELIALADAVMASGE
jgi:molybdopterin-guanine dinucleotide biosynthesis protein B